MKYPINCDCCNPPVIFRHRQDKFYHLNRRSLNQQSNNKMSSTRNNPIMGSSNKRVVVNSNNNSDTESVSRSSKKAKPSVYTKEVFLQNMDMYYDLVQANQCTKDVLETQLNAIKNLYPIHVRQQIKEECEEKLFVMDDGLKVLRETTFDYTEKHDDPHYQNLIRSLL